MKIIKLITLLIFCNFILLFGACKNTPSSVDVPVKPGASTYTDVPGIKTGWDIYTGGVYRYGPSIIINADGSIDGWFAAPGDIFGDRIKNFNDQDTQAATSLTTGASAAQKFSATDPFYAIQVSCPNWASTNSSLTLSLYHWNTDYNTTIAGTAIATVPYPNYNDNQSLEIKVVAPSTLMEKLLTAVIAPGC